MVGKISIKVLRDGCQHQHVDVRLCLCVCVCMQLYVMPSSTATLYNTLKPSKQTLDRTHTVMDHGRFFMTVCVSSQEFVWMVLRDTVKQERVT